MKDRTVIIADMVRTPWGKFGGALEPLISSDLAAPTLKALLQRTGVEPAEVDQVVYGQSHPSTYPNNIGHFAWLKAELPVEIPGYTVQSNDASALQALRTAYYLIASGNDDLVIAGGADSYSTAAFALRDVRNHFYPQHRTIIDTLDEHEQCTQPQPMTAMEKYRLSYGETSGPEALAYTQASRERAAGADWSEALVPVSYTVRKKGEIVVDRDQLHTEGESPLAPPADGAAAAMLMTAEKAAGKGITPLAALGGFAVAGGDPARPQQAGVAAVEKLLKTKGLTMADIACVEILENSAEDVLYISQALGCETVNPLGGALGYGKNDGGEGLFMVMRLAKTLKAGEKGIACIFSAGGQAMAALVEK